VRRQLPRRILGMGGGKSRGFDPGASYASFCSLSNFSRRRPGVQVIGTLAIAASESFRAASVSGRGLATSLGAMLGPWSNTQMEICSKFLGFCRRNPSYSDSGLASFLFERAHRIPALRSSCL